MKTLTVFAMLAGLVATWWAWHAIVRQVVTHFGITGGLITVGVCMALSLIMEP